LNLALNSSIAQFHRLQVLVGLLGCRSCPPETLG
jgi:hypothetical protein